MEVILSPEEFESVRRNRKEIERRFQDLEGLERTLKALRLEYLIDRKNNLGARLEEMKKLYLELVELEEKAKRDREFLIAMRREISEENRSLRTELKGRRNEDNR